MRKGNREVQRERHVKTRRHAGRMLCEGGARQGLERQRKAQELVVAKERQGKILLYRRQGAWPRRHLDFRPQASRTETTQQWSFVMVAPGH